jgi:hypothetical protein
MIVANSVLMQTQTRRKNTWLNKKSKRGKKPKIPMQQTYHPTQGLGNNRIKQVTTQKGHTSHPIYATKPKNHSPRAKKLHLQNFRFILCHFRLEIANQSRNVHRKCKYFTKH